MLATFLVWLIAVAPAPSSQNEASGQFCVSSSAGLFRSETAHCVATRQTHEVVDPAMAHLFLYLSGDRARATFGRSEAGRASVGLTPDRRVLVPLRIESASKSWPLDTDIVVASMDTPRLEWHWSIPSATVVSLRELSLPPGAYTLQVSAPHHESRSLRIDALKKAAPVRILLQPLPVISGSVIDRGTRAPLGGVLIADDSGKTIAVTNGQGEFAAELGPKDAPLSITVSRGQYGTRVIALTRTRANQALPPIELAAGGTLLVTVRRDAAKYPTVSLDLELIDGKKHIRVRHGQIASESVWTADSLADGDYVLTIAGERPLQRTASTVTLQPGERKQLEVRIEPIDLTGSVARGSKRLPHASILVKSSRFGWSSTISTDDDGMFREELWQGGRYAALISAEALSAPYISAKEIEELANAQWDIQIPAGAVTGRVVDARSKKAISDALVTLDSMLPNGTHKSEGTSTKDDGSYAFEGVSPGSHSIVAEAPKFLSADARSFVLSGDDEHQQVDVELTPATGYPLLVVGADQVPLAGAVVVHERLPEGPLPVTDGSGRVDIDIDPALGAQLAVLPKSGSFALVRIAGGAELPHEPRRVVVPNPSASILVKTIDDATGEPVRNIHLLLRYNGEYITPQLAQFLARARGMSLVTNARGEAFLVALPPGTYDFWPYGAVSEANGIMQVRTIPGIVNIPVTSGPYEATIKFTPRFP